jgi:hypothetical protein
MMRLPWLDRDEGLPVLWRDLRSGVAGPWVRLALSVAAAALLMVPLFLVFGVLEIAGRRVEDEFIAIGVGVAGATWCGAVAWLWGTFRRWRRVIKTALGVLGLWVLIVPLCVLVDETMPRGEFLVASLIVLAVALTIAGIAFSAYRGARGRPVEDRAGVVRVTCPACGYSLVGLESCHCPECGSAWTIDAVIRAQGYGGVLEEGDPDAAEEVREVDAAPAPQLEALPDREPERESPGAEAAFVS